MVTVLNTTTHMQTSMSRRGAVHVPALQLDAGRGHLRGHRARDHLLRRRRRSQRLCLAAGESCD